VAAGGPYAVDEGRSVVLAATGADEDGDALTFAWDLDHDGTYETAGATPTFSAAGLDGPSSRTVTVRVTDADGATATAEATVNVVNVAPTATFDAPPTVFAGSTFTLSVSDLADPSPADVAAGLAVAFDCGAGAGYGPFGATTTATCATSDTGSRTVGARVRDKDGGVREYTATVNVTVTVASLCDLVARYAKNAGQANSLCVMLQHGQLAAFANEVDAQTGKAFTPEQAATLKRLATRL
jgi:hypothetical protein